MSDYTSTNLVYFVFGVWASLPWFVRLMLFGDLVIDDQFCGCGVLLFW